MSRIGKKPLVVPASVEVTLEKPHKIRLKGPKGTLEYDYRREIEVVFDTESRELRATVKYDTKNSSAYWGTTLRLIGNMVEGVTNGFSKTLELNGVGFRMNVQGKKINLALGFSHPVEVEVPEGIEVKIDNNTLTISGINKQQVGQFAAEIRALKPVEPYKGKGFKYSDEVVRRKEGKKAAK